MRSGCIGKSVYSRCTYMWTLWVQRLPCYEHLLHESKWYIFSLEYCCWNLSLFMTLFKSITMFCGANIIPRDILHVQPEYEEYFVEYCQIHVTLLWIWIMLCLNETYFLVDYKLASCKTTLKHMSRSVGAGVLTSEWLVKWLHHNFTSHTMSDIVLV